MKIENNLYQYYIDGCQKLSGALTLLQYSPSGAILKWGDNQP